MEFTGRIARVLPKRGGVSQRSGSQWESQPFVFEYFENDSDRYPDSVMLETFDAKIIPYIKEGLEVKIGFGHKTREYTNPQGQTSTFNEIRMYKIESVKKAQPVAGVAVVQPQTGHPAAPQYGQQAQGQAFPPQVDINGNPINGHADDLPF